MTENHNLFLEAIRQEGMTPPDHIEPGKIFRFPGVGKSKGNKAGWAKMFDDGLGGVYGDHSSNLPSKTWQAEKCNTFTPEERAAFKKQVEESRKQAEQERKKYQAERAKVARKIYDAASALDPTRHPYTIKKRLSIGGLVRRGEWPQRCWKDALLFPIYSSNGAITSIQAINTDGTKDFLEGGRIKGCFYLIGKTKDTTGKVFIGEGAFTVAAVVQVMGGAGVVAFSAGNLEAVAQEIKRLAPDAEIIILADDDQKEGLQ